jgi:hypothetical protein
MTTGLVQVAAGIMGFFSPLASSTTRHDGETTGLVIGSGVVALAAGIAWVAWAHHH